MESTKLVFLAMFSIAFVSFHISRTNADAVAPTAAPKAAPMAASTGGDEFLLKEHNKYREMDRLPPLKWDKTLADYAEKHVKSITGTCELARSRGKYGENLAAGTSHMTPIDALKMWVDQKANYNPTTNICAQGKMCGSYTQVVWKTTTKLGCAKAACQNGDVMIVCSYDPPGNIVGQKPF